MIFWTARVGQPIVCNKLWKTDHDDCGFPLHAGLGLSTNSDFAILDECFPYVARRLLSDDSPRMRAALRTFIYGGGDRLNVAKVLLRSPSLWKLPHACCTCSVGRGQHQNNVKQQKWIILKGKTTSGSQVARSSVDVTALLMLRQVYPHICYIILPRPAFSLGQYNARPSQRILCTMSSWLSSCFFLSYLQKSLKRHCVN